MKQIKLSGNNDKYVLVDDEDYKYLSQFKWYSNGRGGVKRATSRKIGRKYILIHREIMKAKPGQMIDHIDRNPLNNQKNNLRFCNYFINNANATLRRDNSSGCRGVYWEKSTKKWLVQLRRNNINKYIGRFENKYDAINARRQVEGQMVAYQSFVQNQG